MVQTFGQERSVIETHFGNEFDSTQAPVKFDNLDFLLSGNTKIESEVELENWVRLNIQSDLSENVVVGNKRVRHSGAVVATVFARENTGTSNVRDLADQVFEVFNNRSVDNISFFATTLTTLPAVNGWIQYVLTTDYYWDRCV